MSNLCFQLKFDEIITTIDAASKTEMANGIKKLKQISDKASKDTQILFFVYYSGHGVMHNTSYAVINSEDVYERYFDLEKAFSRLTELDNLFGILICDCCRNDPPGTPPDNVDARRAMVKTVIVKKPEEEKKEPKPKIVIQRKVIYGTPPVKTVQKPNYIAWFGCNPNEGVDLSSKIAVSISKLMTESVEQNGGVL